MSTPTQTNPPITLLEATQTHTHRETPPNALIYVYVWLFLTTIHGEGMIQLSLEHDSYICDDRSGCKNTQVFSWCFICHSFQLLIHCQNTACVVLIRDCMPARLHNRKHTFHWFWVQCEMRNITPFKCQDKCQLFQHSRKHMHTNTPVWNHTSYKQL